MLGLFRKKADDGEGVLSNLRAVSRWLTDLPVGDPYRAQEQVVQLLIRFNHANRDHGRERLQVLMLVDEKTREMQDSLCRQYLRSAHVSKSMETRLWTTIHAFYWEIAYGYHGFVMNHIAKPGRSKIQAYVQQVALRAMRGFADILKWRYFRYENLDEKVWLNLHHLYRFAETDRFANTPLTVYPDDAGRYTPVQEYGQALLLSLCASGNLTPREIEMVDRWLDNWSDRIHVDVSPDPHKHGFYVDTGKGWGLQRVEAAAASPDLRFLATGDLQSGIERAKAALKDGTGPVSLGLTEDFRMPEGYGLLDQVESAWSAPGQGDRRDAPRHPQSGRWRVIHGLVNICAEFAQAGFGALADHRLSPEAMLDIKLYGFVTERTKERQHQLEWESRLASRQEVWDQHDASRTGIAFRVAARESDWIKIGRLLAVVPYEESDWRIGIVTRLACREDDCRVVGVRLLTGQVQTVGLTPESSDGGVLGYIVDDLDLSAQPASNQALLLRDERSEQLIIDGALYTRERRYILHAPQAGNRVIRLDAVEETGESWLRVGFNAIAA